MGSDGANNAACLDNRSLANTTAYTRTVGARTLPIIYQYCGSATYTNQDCWVL